MLNKEQQSELNLEITNAIRKAKDSSTISNVVELFISLNLITERDKKLTIKTIEFIASECDINTLSKSIVLSCLPEYQESAMLGLIRFNSNIFKTISPNLSTAGIAELDLAIKEEEQALISLNFTNQETKLMKEAFIYSFPDKKERIAQYSDSQMAPITIRDARQLVRVLKKCKSPNKDEINDLIKKVHEYFESVLHTFLDY